MIVKNLINFLIAIGFLLRQSLGLAVSLLQLLQFKLHITNTSFRRCLIGELSLEGILKMLKMWQSVVSAD